jgi:hypothetical protein
LLEGVDGFTHARAFVGPVLADEHVDNNGFPLVVEDRLPALAVPSLMRLLSFGVMCVCRVVNGISCTSAFEPSPLE